MKEYTKQELMEIAKKAGKKRDELCYIDDTSSIPTKELAETLKILLYHKGERHFFTDNVSTKEDEDPKVYDFLEDATKEDLISMVDSLLERINKETI